MSIMPFFQKIKFLVSLPKFGSLVARLFSDPRVPLLLKMGGVAAAVLIVSPLDPFSDIPFLNVLDDTALLMLAARIFVGLCPAVVVAEHRVALGLDSALAPMKNVTPPRF